MNVTSITNILNLKFAGADPGFSFGGGGEIMYPHAYYERWTELTIGRGPAPAKGPWKL